MASVVCHHVTFGCCLDSLLALVASVCFRTSSSAATAGEGGGGVGGSGVGLMLALALRAAENLAADAAIIMRRDEEIPGYNYRRYEYGTV